ncbi:MAG: hypothetical protein ACXWC9_09365 [Pseudobdellovibrionaceae bacterium]
MKLMMSLICCLSLGLTACGAPEPFRRGPEQKPEPDTPSQQAKPAAPDSVSPPENPGPKPPAPPAPSAGLDKLEFEKSILPLLEKKCGLCHQNPAPDFEKAKNLVVFQSLEKSELYLYATGTTAGHRVIFKPNSPENSTLSNWILGIH